MSDDDIRIEKVTFDLGPLPPRVQRRVDAHEKRRAALSPEARALEDEVAAKVERTFLFGNPTAEILGGRWDGQRFEVTSVDIRPASTDGDPQGSPPEVESCKSSCCLDGGET